VSRIASAIISGVTGVVRKRRRCAVSSRREVRARSVGRPVRDGDGLGRFRSCLFSSDDAFRSRDSPDEGGCGRSLNVGAPDADGRGAQRFVFVLFAAQQCSHRASQPLGIERLDEETLGAAAASQEDVRDDDRATSTRRPVRPRRRTPRVAVPCKCHSAHRADLQVKDHQVDAAFFDAGDASGPLATSSMRRSGPRAWCAAPCARRRGRSPEEQWPLVQRSGAAKWPVVGSKCGAKITLARSLVSG